MTPEGRMIQYLRRAVKRAGGVSRKVVFTGHRGAPDQLIMLLGHSFFAEVKAPGCKPSPIQLIEHQTLRTDGSERAIDRMLLAEGASPFSGRGAP